MARLPRVLVVAHGHPERQPGGAEIAAAALHRALRASGEFDSVLLARDDNPFPTHGGTAFSGARAPGEFLLHASLGDRFLFRQADPNRVRRHFRDALEVLRPDIVHFHHFMHLGLEMLGEVRRLEPRVPIAMTLHDFHAICHSEGQMVEPRGGTLCHRATPERCHGCFPSRSAHEFALRELHVKGWLELVDRFVAPSRFLAERYVDWGIAAERIDVIENLLLPGTDRDGVAASPSTPGAPLRLAFFGRINAVKGVDLLLEAVRRLPPAARARVRLDVHGAGLERQPLGRQLALRRALRRLGSSARLHGAYRSEEIPRLMREADWMIVPSRWWENSPLVILEARRQGLPVICADIGGMAEKIEHGKTGLHFRANDPLSLAERIEEALALGGERERFAERIRASVSPQAILERHLALHRELLGAPATAALPRAA